MTESEQPEGQGEGPGGRATRRAAQAFGPRRVSRGASRRGRGRRGGTARLAPARRRRSSSSRPASWSCSTSRSDAAPGARPHRRPPLPLFSPSPSASPSASPTTASPTPSASPSVALLPPSARSQPVPILMYHVLASPPPGARQPFSLRLERRLHAAGPLAALARLPLGHPDAALRLLGRQGRPAGQARSCSAFDDGYRSDWAVGGRVLSRYGYVGVLNLKVGNILPKGGITLSAGRLAR